MKKILEAFAVLLLAPAGIGAVDSAAPSARAGDFMALNPEILRFLEEHVSRPPPKVESVVVRLIPLAEPIVPAEDRWAFRRFVTGLFGQRRRQLIRALRTVTGLSAEAIQDLIGPLGLAATARPEVLTPHEFAALFAAIPR